MANVHGKNTSHICEHLVAYQCEKQNLHPYKPIIDTGIDFILYHENPKKFVTVQVKSKWKDRHFSINSGKKASGDEPWQEKIRLVDFFILVHFNELATNKLLVENSKESDDLILKPEFWIFPSDEVIEIGTIMRNQKLGTERPDVKYCLQLNLDWKYKGEEFTKRYKKNLDAWSLIKDFCNKKNSS